MLINEMAQNGRDTEEGFRKGLRKRMLIYGVFALAGVVMIAALLIATNGELVSGDHISDYQSGFTVGLSSAFIASGIMFFLKTRATLNNPERFQKAYTENIDERNRFVLMKTYQTASMLFMGIIALASIAAGFISQMVAGTLSVCMGLFAIIILIVRRVVNSKY